MPSKAQARKPRRHWLRRIAAGVGLFVVATGAVAGWIVYREISANLPPVDKLLRYQLPVATRVYAADGTLLGEFYTEKRYLVPIARIPAVVRQAFIAAEDSSFYRHKGVDVLGIARAALANFTAGTVVQGGSTITQQVVKSLLLSPEKSYERKFKEILLSLRLERQLTKDEILYLYLNLIYLGNGAYGVGAAAQEYFGKDVGDLDLAEAALLAGLPQAPSRYSPIRHWDRAKYRQRYVLERMARERFVTWEQSEQALQEEIQLTRHDANGPTYAAAPYFVEHVRRFLEERYGGTAPYQAGLNVYTTVDLGMQRAAEQALRTNLDAIDMGRTRARPLRRLTGAEADRFIAAAKAARDPNEPEPGRAYQALVLSADKSGVRVQVNRFTGLLVATKDHPLPSGLARNDLIAVRRHAAATGGLELEMDGDPQLEGALVSIDLTNGYVKALVGGYDYGRSQFNRVMQAQRQPGSSFKPFVYAAAMDRGWTPASIIVDEPIVLAGGRRAWMPKNYDQKFVGPITLRNALAHSRNVVTVKLAQSMGLNYLVNYLPRFGFSRPFAKNLSISLGTAEVTLFELARAYTAFATGGRRLDPIFVTKITDPHGKVLEEFQAQSDPVIAPETAYLVTSMLESVIERGTGKRVAALGRPVAGKTGTTNDMHDAWFVGYTPELLTGVWVGYDSERSLGKEQTGGRVAAPIFLSFMEAALGDAPVSDFTIPDGVTLVSVNGNLECFKKGTEPGARQLVASQQGDELDRAVARLRGREPGELDGERDLAPSDDELDREEPTWAPQDQDDEAPPNDEADLPRLDTRPAPRAEDYLEGGGGARGRHDEDYRGMSDRPARRPISEPADDYRVNTPPPRGGRKIVEEPLTN
ncbi:MAG: PBP1A family penicillin-binding protein [Myxococcales bacterium]|jgi:penicillin-binding protein 1A|nr:PBP1A family penicillin-binding protein [Myxococcales bacterium]